MNRSRVVITLVLVNLLLPLAWMLVVPSPWEDVYAQSGAVSPSELILAMNTLRVSNGLPALISDPVVNSVAQATADIMAANNASWHIGDVRGRIAAAGYGGGATVWATENFAVGNMGIDEIMQMWADPEHMRPATNPAYCHVGAGVSQAADGRYYYVLQAAYTSSKACGPYIYNPGDGSGAGANSNPPVSQIIIPVQVATPDSDGRIYHIVRSGQSFWSIAIAYQITIHDLEVWNNLSRANDLIVGQKLFIPSAGTEGYATPTPVWEVTTATPDPEGKIVHQVQPYQALILIAGAYNVNVDTILNLNNWQVDWPLQVGQNLLISTGDEMADTLSAIEKLTPDSDGYYYHTVKDGEYLAWIADIYDTSLGELLAWNGLTSDSIIQPGQRLFLPVTPPPTRTSTPTQPVETATTTRLPPTPTPTQGATPVPASTTTTPDTQSGSASTPLLLAFLVALVGAAAIILVRAMRGNNEGDSPDEDPA